MITPCTKDESDVTAMHTCGTCEFYLRYSEAYEDPEEPSDSGFCKADGWNCKHIYEDEKACDEWEARRDGRPTTW